MNLNVRVDAATQELPEVNQVWLLRRPFSFLPPVDRTWLIRRPFSFLPPVTYRDQCQLSPTALSDWLQDRASILARAGDEARRGANYTSGSGLPLNCSIATSSATLRRTAWATSPR